MEGQQHGDIVWIQGRIGEMQTMPWRIHRVYERRAAHVDCGPRLPAQHLSLRQGRGLAEKPATFAAGSIINQNS